MNNKFIIIIPTYNAEKYIKRAINSILNQTYKKYKLIVIDDCSNDKTSKIINSFKDQFTKIKLEKHYGSPIYSFKLGVDYLNPSSEDILVTVDGDDQLFDNNVLEYLNKVYNNDIWMTYGQFIPESGSYGKYCKEITDFRNYRRSGKWYASHLRTLRKKIWDLIDQNDLKDDNNEYFKYAGDAAYLYPSLEICGPKHTKFIDKVLYIYNDLNPSNEMKIAKEEQLRIVKKIQEKPLYNEHNNI